MNKLRLLDSIKRLANDRLNDELDYYLNDVEREDAYTLAEAFNDTLDLAESTATRGLLENCRTILIDCGYAIPIDPKTEIVCTGKTYWFRKDNVKYEAVAPWEQWIDE